MTPFTFAVTFDFQNNLYLVKGDSPISLIHFKDEGVYVFASTKQILWKALVDSELFQDLENGKYEHIVLNEGDILQILKQFRINQRFPKYLFC